MNKVYKYSLHECKNVTMSGKVRTNLQVIKYGYCYNPYDGLELCKDEFLSFKKKFNPRCIIVSRSIERPVREGFYEHIVVGRNHGDYNLPGLIFQCEEIKIETP